MVKFRPDKLVDIILPPTIRRIFEKYIEDGSFPHLILVGPKGTGKTSLANVLVHEFNGEVLNLNASEDRGVDTVRDNIKQFVRVQSSKLKIVFLDEADGLTPDAQNALKNIMETYSGDTRFILTGNEFKFIEPIVDRCNVIQFTYINKTDMIVTLQNILKSENVVYPDTILKDVVDKQYPSMRRILNTLQASIVTENDKKLIKEIIYIDGQDYTKLMSTAYDFFAKNELERMREFLIDSSFYEYNLLFRYWFDRVKNPLYKVLITDYLYRDGYMSDKELNFIGMCYALHAGAYPFTLKSN